EIEFVIGVEIVRTNEQDGIATREDIPVFASDGVVQSGDRLAPVAENRVQPRVSMNTLPQSAQHRVAQQDVAETVDEQEEVNGDVLHLVTRPANFGKCIIKLIESDKCLK